MKIIAAVLVIALVLVVATGIGWRFFAGGGNSSAARNSPSSLSSNPTPTLVPPTRTPKSTRPPPTRGGERPTIRLSEEQYQSITLNNAIARFVIEHGYGYPTELVVTTTVASQDLIVSGDIDLEMEGWQHNRLDWYNEAVDTGSIENLGPTYESGPQYFIIPQWMADEYNIRSIEDMKKHWDRLKDPDDATRGLFISCPRESPCAKVNSVKLEAYGLYKFYNVSSPDSFDDLEVILENAQELHQPIFAYYWEPAALNVRYDWQVLEEPEYTEECWDQVRLATEDKVPRPIDRACEFPPFPIDKLAHVGLRDKAPDVVIMLERMHIGLGPLSEIINWAEENNITDSEQMAIRYFETFPDSYRSWMPSENYIEVQKTVRERRGY